MCNISLSLSKYDYLDHLVSWLLSFLSWVDQRQLRGRFQVQKLFYARLNLPCIDTIYSNEPFFFTINFDDNITMILNIAILVNTNIMFFSWPYPSHVFRFLGPRHNRGMGFQNNWYYALLLDWSFGLQCIFFFITLTSSVSSGHVLRKGRPGSTVPAGVSPCSCE